MQAAYSQDVGNPAVFKKLLILLWQHAPISQKDGAVNPLILWPEHGLHRKARRPFKALRLMIKQGRLPVLPLCFPRL